MLGVHAVPVKRIAIAAQVAIAVVRTAAARNADVPSNTHSVLIF